MAEVAVIGHEVEVEGFAPAGALVYVAQDAGQARAAWEGLPATVGLVLLGADAARVLVAERAGPRAPLTAVLP